MAAAGNIPQYAVGLLVRVRDREWVVLPSDDPEVLNLRPLSGSEWEACGIHLGLEGHEVKAAEFPPPDPNAAGDFVAGRLLRDAARLSLRSGAGPFRSLGRISVRPRPYQFVPLIMALRLDLVRLLIADDVGVGKTIEAALIARELLDRGDAERVCVLCPPHLCEQWQRELKEKFHIHAEIVRTSTIARLERGVPRPDLSIYKYYPHLVISIDFVKQDRRKPDFLAHCPDLVIVDEAHAAAHPGGRAFRDQQQRHELVREIAKGSARHLLLLTATPHSGIEENFLSLLGLLNPHFERLSLNDLDERERAALARHFVQRRRADLEKWLGAETPFPKRDSQEETYLLAKDYLALFDDVLEFTRETVFEEGLNRFRQRVRYWAALSLLRSLMSSPAAAVQALSTRAGRTLPTAEAAEDAQEELRRREMLDPLIEDGTLDAVPQAAVEVGEGDLAEGDRRKLREFARRARAIFESGQDTKLDKAAEIVAGLLQRGHRPIVYCRFIETAKYVAEELEKRLRVRFPDIRALAVTSETGGDEEREERVNELSASPRRVLVATDCLSEGINLQDHFDAVLHYDLPWNPNRLEQREGRVDRYGQQKREVPAVILWGKDNPIDGIVLDVLIRKARKIFSTLGIHVPVPVDSESVVEALVEGLYRRQAPEQLRLGLEGMETVRAFHEEWDREAEREKISRTRFAQHVIKPDEVAQELEATDQVLGDPDAVKQFLLEAAQRLPFSLQPRDGYYVLDPATLPADIGERLRWKKPQPVVFDSPPPKEELQVLGRNHPLVEALSNRILGNALGAQPENKFSRCGSAYTNLVKLRTVVALLRIRYRLSRHRGPDLLAEELLTTGFQRFDDKIEWLAPNGQQVLTLLEKAVPVGQISQQERVSQVEWARQTLLAEAKELEAIADRRAQELEESHARLRQYTGGGQIKARPHRPDILALYIFLPAGSVQGGR